MKMLVVLALAALLSTWAEGRLVSKCELKTLLEEAALWNTHNRLTYQDIVAKIVCHVEKGARFQTSAVRETVEQGVNHGDTWTLYGLFQLSDHLICSNGTGHSPNLCDMNCSELIDDNVADDIKCLETIKTKFHSEDFTQHKESFIRMIRIVFQNDCKYVLASTYFAECNSAAILPFMIG